MYLKYIPFYKTRMLEITGVTVSAKNMPHVDQQMIWILCYSLVFKSKQSCMDFRENLAQE